MARKTSTAGKRKSSRGKRGHAMPKEKEIGRGKRSFLSRLKFW